MNLGVIFGGNSPEHDISILTAIEIKKRYKDIYLIYISKDQNYYLAKNINLSNFKKKKIYFINGGIKRGFKKIKLDFVFIANHGINGEDGSSYSLLNMFNIKTVGSNSLISSISMRKDLFKKFIKFKTIENQDILNPTFPNIIKPVDGGSSIGISVAYNKLEYEMALQKAYTYSKKVIVEPFFKNCREFNCAVCFDKISEVYEVSNGFLSFEKKYLENVSKRIIKNELSNIIKKTSKEIYDLGYSGVIRVDFLYHNDILYVNEVNTIPGGLSIDMFDFDILEYMIKETNKEYQNKIKIKFETNIKKKYLK